MDDFETEVEEFIDPVAILGLNRKTTKKRESVYVSGRDINSRKRKIHRKGNALAKSSRKKEISSKLKDDVSEDLDVLMDNSIKQSGLSYRKRKAIRCLVIYDYDIEHTAAEIGVTPSTIKAWLKKPEFQRVFKSMEKFITVNAMRRRLDLNNEIIDNLYDEILMRIHRGDLGNIPFTELTNLLFKFSNESRQDDKQSFVNQRLASDGKQQSIHIELVGIQERFNLRRIRRQFYSDKQRLLESSNDNNDKGVIDVKFEKENVG